MDDKLVIFGPWVGEFSYELGWWIPQIRKIKNQLYPHHTSLACGFRGRKGLYKDFTSEYISHPQELEILLKHPSAAGDHINGRDIIPPIFIQYLNTIQSHYQKEFNEVVVVSPNDFNFNSNIVLSDNPPGEFINYQSSRTFDDYVKNKIKTSFKDPSKETISIMARSRYRNGGVDREDWDPKNWELLIEKILKNLNLNIILINIPQVDSKGGSVNFHSSKLLKKYKDSILCLNVEGDDSIEIQFSILKNTKCSFYGGTGAATLPFLTNTPVFTQQTKENGYRLNFEWQKKLTNGHRKVKIFDKYPMGDIYNSPVDELFNEFKKFYKKL